MNTTERQLNVSATPLTNGAANPEDVTTVPASEAASQPGTDAPSVAGKAVPKLTLTVPPAPSSVVQDFNLMGSLAGLLVEEGPVEVVVDTGLEIVHARKPSDTRFVAIYPEHRVLWMIKEDRDARRPPYLVVPAIGETNMPICRKAVFYAWVDEFGTYGVWSLLQENVRGEIHPYQLSARKKLEAAIARGGWYSFRTVEGQQAYKLVAATQDYGIPKWPAGGIEQLLAKAFEGRVINSQTHSVLVALRGKPVPEH